MRGEGGTHAIGLDMGGTFLKAARIDEQGRIRAHIEQPVSKAPTAEPGADAGVIGAARAAMPGVPLPAPVGH